MEQAFRLRGGVPKTAMSQPSSANADRFKLEPRGDGTDSNRAGLLEFLARDDHRVSQRFLVQEWKWKRHVLIELRQVRDIGATLGQDLAHFF